MKNENEVLISINKVIFRQFDIVEIIYNSGGNDHYPDGKDISETGQITKIVCKTFPWIELDISAEYEAQKVKIYLMDIMLIRKLKAKDL